MKHNRRCRKLIAILLCICLMVPMISGCGEKKEEETKQTSSGTLVFQYGNNLVTKGEVYIYIETVRERYEMQYGSARRGNIPNFCIIVLQLFSRHHFAKFLF